MVEFKLLGPLEVDAGSGPLPLGGGKQRALLADLLLHANEVVPTDQLIEDLWGESPPETAAKALQGHVSALRKLLGAEGAERILTTRPPGYAIELAPEQLDLAQFQRLRERGGAALADRDTAGARQALGEALSLWRGPPLADLTYESFAQPEIARLEELRLATLEDRIEADLEAACHAELVAELEALVRGHPLRERLRGQLMLALYRSGRQAEALECYRAGRQALIEELGIEPGRALQDLETAILRQDPSLDAPRVAIPAAPTGSGGEPLEGVGGTASAEPLVGRAEQIGELRSALDAAFLGRGIVFMIGGEAGIGKTRLADELAEEARDRGARIIWGRCWEAGGAPAYWPWVQVLRSLIQAGDGVDVRAIRELRGNPLQVLIPELSDQSSEPAGTPESESARFQLFDAVALLLCRAAVMQPVVIVLDDLHAADTPSLLLLQFLAGQLGGAPILLLGLHRDDERDDQGTLSACLAHLAREQATRRMRLGGLNMAETAAVIEAIARRRIPESVGDRIHVETEGNPLFVGEIVRLLDAEGLLEHSSSAAMSGVQLPETIRAVIEERLRRLTAERRRLLSDAAVLGREFGVRELAALAEMDDRDVLDALDEAIAARVVSEVPSIGRLRFSHALIRETLYEALGANQRREAHLRAGEILERIYAADPRGHLAELAHHFFAALPAGDSSRAVEYGKRAGDHAVAQLAFEEAARLYALALSASGLRRGDDEEERCTLLVALGDAQARGGDEPAARQAFLDAAEIASGAGLPILQAQAALGYGGRMVWARAYDDPHLIPLLEAALEALPDNAAGLRARLMARLAGALRDHRPRERRASLSGRAVEIARSLGDPATLAYTLDGHQGAILWPETPAERLEIADEILALAEQVGDDERATSGRLYRLLATLELGRMAEAEAELWLMGEQAAALRQPAQLWVATACRANLALFQGRFQEAERLIDDALTLGQRAQSRDAVLSHRLQLFVLHQEIGGASDMELLLREAAAEFPMRPVFRCALANLYAELGDVARCRAAIDELAPGDFAAIQRDNEYLFALGFLADAVHMQGDERAAASLYELLSPYAHLNAINADEIGTGSVARHLGALATTMRRWDDAARDFETAMTLNREWGARPWLAHSEHGCGLMLQLRGRSGDRHRSQQLLSTALAEYEMLGMTPWAVRAAEALGAV